MFCTSTVWCQVKIWFKLFKKVLTELWLKTINDTVHTLTTPYEYVSQVSDTGRLWMTSGAIQGNVPTRDMWVVWEWNLEAPKSQIWGHGESNWSADFAIRVDFSCLTNKIQAVWIFMYEQTVIMYLEYWICCQHNWNENTSWSEKGQKKYIKSTHTALLGVLLWKYNKLQITSYHIQNVISSVTISIY